MSPVDRLAALAATAEPPPLDATTSRRMLDRAVSMRPAPERARASLRWLAIPVLAAALLVALVVRRPDAPRESSSHIALATGDRLVGTPGARFDVESLAPADRRIRLHAGTMLFAVSHLVLAQRFDVVAGDLVVRATGTVFSVDATPSVVTVVVFEGVVQVIAPDAMHELRPGAMYRHDIVMRVASRDTPPTLVSPPSPAVETKAIEAKAVEAKAVEAKAVEAKTVEVVEIEPDVPEAPVAGPGDLTIARAHVAARRYTDALDEASRATTLTGDWYLVIGDAQRGLGHASDAADAFERATAALRGAEQAEAAYTAAYLRFRELGQGAAALAALDAGAVDAEGSALEERGLALRTQILVTMGRADDAKARAATYLERFPHGGQRAVMRKLLAGK